MPKSDLAHLVEHSTSDRRVIGAIPIIETNGGMVGYNHLAFSIFDRGFWIWDRDNKSGY